VIEGWKPFFNSRLAGEQEGRSSSGHVTSGNANGKLTTTSVFAGNPEPPNPRSTPSTPFSTERSKDKAPRVGEVARSINRSVGRPSRQPEGLVAMIAAAWKIFSEVPARRSSDEGRFAPTRALQWSYSDE